MLGRLVNSTKVLFRRAPQPTPKPVIIRINDEEEFKVIGPVTVGGSAVRHPRQHGHWLSNNGADSDGAMVVAFRPVWKRGVIDHPTYIQLRKEITHSADPSTAIVKARNLLEALLDPEQPATREETAAVLSLIIRQMTVDAEAHQAEVKAALHKRPPMG